MMMEGMCGTHSSKRTAWHALLLPLHTWERRLAPEFWKDTQVYVKRRGDFVEEHGWQGKKIVFANGDVRKE